MSDYLTIAIVVLAFYGVKGHGSGAGSGACTNSSMIPGHNVPAQTGASPYTISASPTKYNAGTSVSVTLQGANADTFIGFLVLALPADDPTAAATGSFATALHSGNGRAISQNACTGGATHTSTFGSLNANSLELMWTAPLAQGVNITFYATFVQGYSVFYVKQDSSTVEFDPNYEPPTTATTTMPTTTMPTTTMPTTTMPTTTMPTTTMVSETTTSATTQKSTLALVVFSTLLWLMLH